MALQTPVKFQARRNQRHIGDAGYGDNENYHARLAMNSSSARSDTSTIISE
jgi:hypothetical protein